ncbi:MAG: SDR family oxidoreductase [Nitriliruptoraceae bacterium]|nr:SDR family oxidoreductase [Nitriliruptoraceae bacterium]
MTNAFEGRVALVTGAGSGIGAATARLLAERGATVVVTDLDGARARQVAADIEQAGGLAWSEVLDVADGAAWAALAATIDERAGRIDVVVNNAFTLTVAPAHEQDEATWHRQLDVDLTSVYRSVRTFIGALRASRGNVVNVSSVHATVAFPGHPAYAAAKGGMLALTRQLAVEYGPQVRVNTVLPGPIHTPVWDGADEAYLDLTRRSVPAARLGTAREVATAIAFLAGDDASYISGASLVVDGGFTAQKDPR